MSRPTGLTLTIESLIKSCERLEMPNLYKGKDSNNRIFEFGQYKLVRISTGECRILETKEGSAPVKLEDVDKQQFVLGQIKQQLDKIEMESIGRASSAAEPEARNGGGGSAGADITSSEGAVVDTEEKVRIVTEFIENLKSLEIKHLVFDFYCGIVNLEYTPGCLTNAEKLSSLVNDIEFIKILLEKSKEAGIKNHIITKAPRQDVIWFLDEIDGELRGLFDTILSISSKHSIANYLPSGGKSFLFSRYIQETWQFVDKESYGEPTSNEAIGLYEIRSKFYFAVCGLCRRTDGLKLEDLKEINQIISRTLTSTSGAETSNVEHSDSFAMAGAGSSGEAVLSATSSTTMIPAEVASAIPTATPTENTDTENSTTTKTNITLDYILKNIVVMKGDVVVFNFLESTSERNKALFCETLRKQNIGFGINKDQIIFSKDYLGDKTLEKYALLFFDIVLSDRFNITDRADAVEVLHKEAGDSAGAPDSAGATDGRESGGKTSGAETKPTSAVAAASADQTAKPHTAAHSGAGK